MKIFFDSSFLIAYAVKTDEFHKKAIKLKNTGIFDSERFTSNYMIDEVITSVGKSKHIELAKETYYILKDNFQVLNEYDINNFNDKVMSTFEEYDANLSFANCAVVEIMKENDIENLVSFDSYFDNVKDITRIQ